MRLSLLTMGFGSLYMQMSYNTGKKIFLHISIEEVVDDVNAHNVTNVSMRALKKEDAIAQYCFVLC